MKLTKEQSEDIKNQQSQSNETKRVTAPELEKILYEAIPALDHGFVRVVDYMGDDTSIVQSARVSYGKGTKQVVQHPKITSTFCTVSNSRAFSAKSGQSEVVFLLSRPNS